MLILIKVLLIYLTGIGVSIFLMKKSIKFRNLLLLAAGHSIEDLNEKITSESEKEFLFSILIFSYMNFVFAIFGFLHYILANDLYFKFKKYIFKDYTTKELSDSMDTIKGEEK